MLYSHYVEWNPSDDYRWSVSATGTWETLNVNNTYQIPSGAVLEIAIANLSYNTPHTGGVRKYGSSDSRYIKICKSQSAGESYVTMHTQSDEIGRIQYYGSHTSDIRFSILGYWEGCHYTEMISGITEASFPDVWRSISLSGYGVPESGVSEILCTNSATGSQYYGGIRPSGSSVERKFILREAEYASAPPNGGNSCATVLVQPVGEDVGIQFYREDVSVEFTLLGYFDYNPGEYISTNILFPSPSSDNVWQTLTVSSSGFVADSTTQFLIGQVFSDYLYAGVRQFDSSYDRRLKLDYSDSPAVTGLTLAGMHALVDASGRIKYNASDVSDAPKFYGIGYWTNYNETYAPHQKIAEADLFTKGTSQYAHYIEMDCPGSPVSTASTWETVKITGPGFGDAEPSTEAIPAVAEIMFWTNSKSSTMVVGARSVGSSLERTVTLAQSPTSAGLYATTMHVPIDQSGYIQVYISNTEECEFQILGCWRGGHYTETISVFAPTGDDVWHVHNLGTAYADSVAEIIIANGDQLSPLAGGTREVGTDVRREQVLVPPTGIGNTCTTMFVNTSGSSGTIEIYGEKAGLGAITMYCVGYWSTPPGRYTQAFEDLGDVAGSALWLLTYVGDDLPSGCVAEIAAEHGDYNSNRSIGARQSGSSNENRKRTHGYTNYSPDGSCYNVIRSMVNVSDDQYVEFYHQSAGDDHILRSLGYFTDFIRVALPKTDQIDLYLSAFDIFNDSCDLFISAKDTSTTSGTMYIEGHQNIEFSGNLFLKVPEFKSDNINLFILGNDFLSDASDLFTKAHAIYNDDIDLYTKGSGIIPHSSGCDLFMAASVFHSGSIDLFCPAYDRVYVDIDLIIFNRIDPCSGLIRDYDAIFYLRNYENDNYTTEYINNEQWDIPGIYFCDIPLIGDHTATETPGDGTLPKYNSLGDGLASNQNGFSSIGQTPLQQNILGAIEDYQYAGSGSITAAFWMSGCHTSGNAIDIGWFKRFNPLDDIGNAYPIHCVGLKIEGTSGISVKTSVKDIPYDQETAGGLWWGGTSHYGTPVSITGTYHTWTEQWPTINVSHDDVAFFVLRSNFIPSGTHPAHMKVYLSVDGQPWTYIGSGLTGPPVSSTLSSPSPNNLYAENAVGFRVQATNHTGGKNNCSIAVSEIACWSDTAIFETDELSDLYDVVAIYNRPLIEYKPTIVPPTTYINRTIGSAIYDPSDIVASLSDKIICSGMLISLEVGLGNYGEDANAYLLEETIPSGFIVRNISPVAGEYPRQQIFHDPQSGVLHSEESTIRWINHHNHPEFNQRRSPLPTKTFTYEVYPVFGDSDDVDDIFLFSGSGTFIGSENGIFVISTTGDVSGTVVDSYPKIIQSDCNLFISGPTDISGSCDLYLRTIERLTTRFIGVANKTPDAFDLLLEADGLSDLDSFAGIEYGPHLYTRGPRTYEGEINLIIVGPVGASGELFSLGHESLSNSGNLFITGYEIEISGINLYTIGPIPESGISNLYTQAGAFTRPHKLLFSLGHENTSEDANAFIHGHTVHSGSCDLYIGPAKTWDTWYLFIQTDDNIENDSIDLYTYGHPSGSPSVGFSSKSLGLYITAENSTYPYTGGGLRSWTLFVFGPSGTTEKLETWTLFVSADFTTINDCSLYTYGHPSGSNPHGNEFNDSCELFIENIEEDPTSIGYIPFNTNNDPWSLFVEVTQGTFEHIDLYMSGYATPIISASGSFFIEGLFEQISETSDLYLMGVSGIINTGPSGVLLFLDGITQPYYTDFELYIHGY